MVVLFSFVLNGGRAERVTLFQLHGSAQVLIATLEIAAVRKYVARSFDLQMVFHLVNLDSKTIDLFFKSQSISTVQKIVVKWPWSENTRSFGESCL